MGCRPKCPPGAVRPPTPGCATRCANTSRIRITAAREERLDGVAVKIGEVDARVDVRCEPPGPPAMARCRPSTSIADGQFVLADPISPKFAIIRAGAALSQEVAAGDGSNAIKRRGSTSTLKQAYASGC